MADRESAFGRTSTLAHHTTDHSAIDEPLVIEPAKADRIFGIGLAMAVAGFVLALATCWIFGGGFAGGLRRLMLSYLTAYAFVLTIALAALGFVLLQHAVKAGWSVNVRRVPEILARMLFPLLAVLGLPLLATLIAPKIDGVPTLYPWATAAFVEADDHDDEYGSTDDEFIDGAMDAALSSDEGVGALRAFPGIEQGPIDADGQAYPSENRADWLERDHTLTEQTITVGRANYHLKYNYLTEKKEAYLNRPFFLVRYVIYFGILWGLANFFWKRSTRQDATGDPKLTNEMTRWSYIGLVIWFMTLTFMSFDLVMSVDPHFFSTIFGIYLFSGGAIGFFSVTILAYLFLNRAGLLTRSVTVEHYHDLGKFLFAFVFFWGYIAFSQFMLLWYANIPETTYWLGIRGMTTVWENRYMGAWPEDPNAPAGFGWWNIVALVMLFGHLLVPFALLMSRHVKRNLTLLGVMAGWMLTMHYVDLYWIIMPETLMGGWRLIPVVELACLMLVAGVSVAWFARELKAVKLRPAADPRTVESLAFHNV
jgi:hypothetical protein